MKQYQLVIVNLDSTIGSEIKKTRPCVIISPNEMNENLSRIIISPITSNKKKYPTRVSITKKPIKGMIALDQIRTIDKRRVVSVEGFISAKTIVSLKARLKEMLID